VSSPTVDTYSSFYEEQARWASEWRTKALAGLLGLAFALVALLAFLQSPPLVWAYIAGLYIVACLGFRRFFTALGVAREAIDHLNEVAKLVHEKKSRGDLLEWVAKNVSPRDRSNVPEALDSLAQGTITGDSIRVAASSAFAQPVSELNFAAFLRTALVLGGLFGTVLFFAMELSGPALINGSLADLLPGLRGALASTLTGILGSLALGYSVSRIDKHVDDLIRGTEAFLGGPLSVALAAVPGKSPIHSEVELWESLRTEVSRLTEQTQAAFERMGSDIHAHAAALQKLGEQLGAAPAITVPPELANLHTVIGDFSRGTELLNKTATALIQTVGSLGVFAPTKMLQDIEQMNRSVDEHQRRMDRAMAQQSEHIAQGLGKVGTQLQRAAGDMERAGQTLEQSAQAAQARVAEVAEKVVSRLGTAADLTGVHEAATQTLSAVHALQNDAAATRSMLQAQHEAVASTAAGLSGVHAAADRTLETVQRLHDDLAATRTALEAGQSGAASTAADVQRAATSLQSLTGTITTAAQQLSGVAPTLESQAAATGKLADAVEKQSGDLGALSRRLARLDEVFRWHDRARRAPLMRFLTLPWRPGSRAVATSGADGGQ
jgi:hypothetical protein